MPIRLTSSYRSPAASTPGSDTSRRAGKQAVERGEMALTLGITLRRYTEKESMAFHPRPSEPKGATESVENDTSVSRKGLDHDTCNTSACCSYSESVQCALVAGGWVGCWLSREPDDAWGRLWADRR